MPTYPHTQLRMYAHGHGYTYPTSALPAAQVPTWTWHRVDCLPNITALSASLFHVRAAPLLTAAPLFTALVVPNMLKELVGWKTQ